MRCPRCQHENATTMKFCGECGTPLTAANPSSRPALSYAAIASALSARPRELAEAPEQQAATAEILRVLSRSPTDLQPVFDIIAQSAVRLCGAQVGVVTRFDGEWVHLGASHGPNAAGIEAARRTYPMRPTGAGGAARAIRDRAVVHI